MKSYKYNGYEYKRSSLGLNTIAFLVYKRGKLVGKAYNVADVKKFIDAQTQSGHDEQRHSGGATS